MVGMGPDVTALYVVNTSIVIVGMAPDVTDLYVVNTSIVMVGMEPDLTDLYVVGTYDSIVDRNNAQCSKSLCGQHLNSNGGNDA